MVYKIDLLNSICTDNYNGTGGHVQNITALNEWCVLAGGTGGHRFDISAYNELSTLYGGTGGYKYDIDALNEICVLSGGTGGHRFAVDALVELGALLNQYPAVLDDGNTVGWYDYTATDTITKDGSNFVSQWRSRIGTNHLNQAVGTNQPLLTATGILFDGVDNVMKTAAFTFNQPELVYLVINQKTWSLGNGIVDGNLNNTGKLTHREVSPRLGLRAPTSIMAINNQLNVYKIISYLINGTSTYINIDGTRNITTDGSPGTNNMGGITIGAQGDASGGFANIEVKELIARRVADNVTNETAIFNYLKNKYGL